MTKLRCLGIAARPLAAFAVVLVCGLAFSLFALTRMRDLAGLTETLYDHPLKVSNAATRASLGPGRSATSRR